MVQDHIVHVHGVLHHRRRELSAKIRSDLRGDAERVEPTLLEELDDFQTALLFQYLSDLIPGSGINGMGNPVNLIMAVVHGNQVSIEVVIEVPDSR